MTEEIFIPFNVASSKNSKQIVRMGKITRLIDSKTTRTYKENTEPYYIKYRNTFREWTAGNLQMPYYVSFKFIRGTRHKFDYINAAQVVQDLMVKHDWIEDDNCTCMIPVFEPYEYNKENPGVFIKIINRFYSYGEEEKEKNKS